MIQKRGYNIMGTEIIQSQDDIRPIFYCSAQNPVASYLHCIKAKALTVLVPQLLL